MRLFNKVAIVGTGLIGGSLGQAIKKRRLAQEVIGISRRQRSISIAKRKDAIDSGGIQLDLIKDADLIILALPVNNIIEKLPGVFAKAKKGAIIIDVASTKVQVLKVATRLAKNNLSFLGCHPLAGSEKRGIENACADLFTGTLCILTPLKSTKKDTLRKIAFFWHCLGAKTTILSAAKHDEILGFTSHLPHALAFSLINSIPAGFYKFSATGLKDTTRIASSDAGVWQDIFITNRKELLKSIDSFKRTLERLRHLLNSKDSHGLFRFLQSAKDKRESLQ